jgi:AcrR family transcriptional regulator
VVTARAAKQIAERRNRDSEVVAAGIKVFHSRGFSAATMQDVADEVGVLKGSLYHYISSKEDLLYRILKESHDQAAAIMDEVAALQVTPIERLRAYLLRIHMWYLTNHERANVYYNQQRYLTGRNREEVRAQARAFEQFLRELLAEARGSGVLRPDLDLRLATLFLLGALNSLPRWYQPGSSYQPEQVAEAFTDMAVRALLPDPVDAKPRRRRS